MTVEATGHQNEPAIPPPAINPSQTALDTGPLEPTDETLLDRVAARDLDALDRLYERHGRAAFSIAYSIVGSVEAAEDVVQDAFLTIWRRAGTYVPSRGNARTWMLTVTRHRAIDIVRARAARPSGVSLDIAGALAAQDGDPAAEAMRRIEATSVRAALDVLPSAQRQVIDLAFFSGLSYPEIAERIGLPLGTVKSRIRLALERLRLVLLPTPTTA
ncbi:MAG: RNA polymerase sigma factor [Dehalococcoidia bacterium]